MDIMEAIKVRHSVRRYTDKVIEQEKVESLNKTIDEINKETGLHIQLITNEPEGFTGMMAHYGNFEGVRNYIVMAGPKNMDREIGYYGEKVVLCAQMLGLNTCWVAMTFNKRKAQYKLEKGEKMYVVISLGYGSYQGKERKSKSISEVTDVYENCPEWYRNGVDAALLAPTAMNQQKFNFSLSGDKVISKNDRGFYAVMDLGIVQYHFDIASGRENFGLKV